MLILGIDPGATTGWCLYHGGKQQVLGAGTFNRHHWSDEASEAMAVADAVAIESFFEPHGGIYPDTVLAAMTEGRLQEAVAATRGVEPVLYTRLSIKQALTEATLREVVVQDDRTCKAALVLLHGDGSDKKGGAIWPATNDHRRAALAVAWMHARLTP